MLLVDITILAALKSRAHKLFLTLLNLAHAGALEAMVNFAGTYGQSTRDAQQHQEYSSHAIPLLFVSLMTHPLTQVVLTRVQCRRIVVAVSGKLKQNLPPMLCVVLGVRYS